MSASAHQDPLTKRNSPDLLRLTWIFLRVGAFAFGGLGSTLALVQRDLVDKRGLITAHDVSDALAYTKPLPGSTGVQLVAFLGWRLHGWLGALLASVAFVAPATVLMIAAAAGTASLPDEPWIKSALLGLQVAVVGLLASAMWRLARSEANTTALTFVLLAGLCAGFFVNAAFVVLSAGLAGVLTVRLRQQPQRDA